MSRLKKIALCVQSALRRSFMALCGVFPLRNRAVFTSFSGKAYSDNPRTISEALHELSPETQIIWLFNNPDAKKSVVPDCVQVRRTHSLAGICALATSRAWVDNMPKPDYTVKRKRQFYVQTWHGDRGFKKMLYDAPDHPSGKKILESEIADALVSGSTHCERTYDTGFGYHGALMKVGSPRNDAVMNPRPENIARIKQKLGLQPDEKVLLYAPTMRNSSRRQGVKQRIQSIDLLKTLDALDARFGGGHKCIVRAHSTQLGLAGYPVSERVLDASAYEDMSDLLLVSDFLITDYSSSAGDFALTGRPIVLFQDDREAFAQEERTFYFDIESSPYVVVQNQAELEAYIETLTIESAQRNDRDILSFYGAYETGEASKRVAEAILETMC